MVNVVPFRGQKSYFGTFKGAKPENVQSRSYCCGNFKDIKPKNTSRHTSHVVSSLNLQMVPLRGGKNSSHGHQIGSW